MALADLPCGPLEGLLPPVVAVEESAGAMAGELWPVERLAVAGAAGRRVSDFAAGRAAARSALARLGHPAVAVPVGRRRQPVWPPGVVGSITHTEGHVAAAVAWADDVRALGIDVEKVDAVGPDLALHVVGPAEAGPWRQAMGRAWAAAVFSLKESVFKATYPLAGVELGFLDVATDVAPDGRVTVRPASHRAADLGLDGLSGGAVASAGHVFTAVWLGPEDRP